MIEAIGLVTFGLLVGAYGTLVGIGGGPILVPMLLFAYKFPPSAVIAISLFAVVANTLSGSIAYLRDNRIDLISGTKFGLAAIPGALVSTWLADSIKLSTFSFYVGVFLLVLAGYVFVRSFFFPLKSGPSSTPQQKNDARNDVGYASALGGQAETPVERVIVDSQGNVFRYAVKETLGMVITAIIGVLSTFLGIGGGLIQVPAMVYLLGFPVHIGTATSHLITAINAGFTLIPFILHGDVVYKPAILLAIGIVVGAQVGARWSTKLPGEKLMMLLIPVMALAGLRLLFN